MSRHGNAGNINERRGSAGTSTSNVRHVPETHDTEHPSTWMVESNLSPLYEIIQELKRKNSVVAAASTGPQTMSLLDHSRTDPWGSSEEAAAGLDDEFYAYTGLETSTRTSLTRKFSSIFSDNVSRTPSFGNLCTCQTSNTSRRPSWENRYAQRRASFGFSSPARNTGDTENGRQSSGDIGECPECGKPLLDSAGNSGRGSNGEERLLSMIHNPNSPRQLRMNTWLDSPRIRRLEAPRHAEELLLVTPRLRTISAASTDMNVADSVNTTNIFSLLLPPASRNAVGGQTSNQVTFASSSDRQASSSTGSLGSQGSANDYKSSLKRDKANQQAANELASLLWICAHEMSLEDYGVVESETFTRVFHLIHSVDNLDYRMAGLAALNALIEAPSADEEKKAIKFANTLSGGLRTAHGSYEFLSAAAKALGHMARRNVDFVESEITRALEWLRTERSDRRLAATLTLREFAINAPTAFYSKTSQLTLGQGGSNEFLDYIFQAIRDPQPIVRACAADALSQCLKILMDRQHTSLTGLLCQVHLSVMEGLELESPTSAGWGNSLIAKVEAMQHGSLLVVATMIAQTRDFMLPRYEEVCRKVLDFISHPKALVQLEVIRLLPRLARRCPKIFARRYLDRSLDFLLQCASTAPPQRVGVDLRPSAFASIGLLVLSLVDPMTGEVIGGANLPTLKISDDLDRPGESLIVDLCESGAIYERLDEIFRLVKTGLTYQSAVSSRRSRAMHIAAFHCAADLVEALGDMAHSYLPGMIDDMFRAGLSNDLIQCLHAIAECSPDQQAVIEDRLFQEVSLSLAGLRSARNLCDPLVPQDAAENNIRTANNFEQQGHLSESGAAMRVDDRSPTEDTEQASPAKIRIDMSTNPSAIKRLVLSLQTLGTFGDAMGRVATYNTVVPILPFVQNVAAPYLSHPSSEVRQAAALTCCTLLVPTVDRRLAGSLSAQTIEDVLEILLRVAVSDPTPIVRLCIVRSLDSRYDPFLCQARYLKPLFLLLQDEALATRDSAIRLLGRLASYNPAPILPFIRKFLLRLLVELQCGSDTGRGREEATRMLVVFLKAQSFQRLIHPVLPAMVESLPLDGGTPRLASAALEALGELAKAAGALLQPWVKEVVPVILETLQDQSSASKQRTSLRTLAQIAGSTGYVIQPYIDYPRLLAQATDILPGTKRAPWSLRREVIRTLGVLGALDPDRYRAVAPRGRKGGAVGGAYFIVLDEHLSQREGSQLVSGDIPLGTSCADVLSAMNGSAIATLRMSSSTNVGRSGVSFQLGKKHSSSHSDLEQNQSDSEDLPAHLFMYEQYAAVAQPASIHTPAHRMEPDDDGFYPTVAIQALMRIFKNQSLAVHHGMVMQAIMFIFKSLGLRCVPFLRQVVPQIMVTIKTCGPSNLRESLLKQVSILSGIVREHLRPYVGDVFDIVEQFWFSRHLSTIFSLISHIAVGCADEFKRFVPRLIKLYLVGLDELQITEFGSSDGPVYRGRSLGETERLQLILCSIQTLREVLGDFLHVLVPVLLKLVDSLIPFVIGGLIVEGDVITYKDLVALSVLTLNTTSALLECEGTSDNTKKNDTPYWGEKRNNLGSLSARAVQPLLRLLHVKCRSNHSIGLSVVSTITVCARQLGFSTWVPFYHEVVRKAIVDWQTHMDNSSDQIAQQSGLAQYDKVIKTLENPPSQRSYLDPYAVEMHRPERIPHRRDSMLLSRMDQSNLGENPTNIDTTGDCFDLVSTKMPQTNLMKVNQVQLQRAWDVSQCASREDWDEWMRRLGIQLLREAPSPALRASAGLAHAYQPLSRELFSAAFVCCWKELSEPYRVNLVNALETAFVADISPEILQALLNLAEFMEHDRSGGLPIDIPTLANLALKCRAYAKALHYKEREYNLGGSNACVEALISINRKLDLQEAALGVLKSATMRFEEQHMDDDMTTATQSTAGLHRQHSPHEMFYSIIWSTEDRRNDTLGYLDLAENKERWLAKLGSWTDALEVYEEKLMRNPDDFDATLGCMRCLSSSGEWRRVLELGEENWHAISASTANLSAISQATIVASRDQKKALRMCAEASWRLGRWNDLDKYSSELVHGQQNPTYGSRGPLTATHSADGHISRVDFEGAFFSAVLHVHREEWTMAAEAIDASRKAMDGRFTALMAESYNRAYPSMVTAQTLAELEEIVEYRKSEINSRIASHRNTSGAPDSTEARERLLSVWRDRLAGCRFDAEVHSSIMAVRSLILGPTDEVDATLTLSELSRQAQRFKLAERVLLDPLEKLGADFDGAVFGFGIADNLGLYEDMENAMQRFPITTIIDHLVVDDSMTYLPTYRDAHYQLSKQIVDEAGGHYRLIVQHKLYFAFLRHLWLTERKDEALHRMKRLCDVVDLTTHCESINDHTLCASCWLEYGEWQIEENITPNAFIPKKLQAEVLSDFKRAKLLDGSYKAHHNWGLLNFRIAQHMGESSIDSKRKRKGASIFISQRNHVVVAIKAFVRAISLGTKSWSASVQQDMLNFLTCLFQYGEQSSIAGIINECVESVPIETWLGVLPQLLARIHIKSPAVRSVLHPLLVRLGEKHPQALMYPLSVLLKSPVVERKTAAESLMNSLRSHSSSLVEEALMVSSELIRVAILWLETWHEGLEEASRLYFGEGNVSGMLDLLIPLHEKLEEGAETRRELEFIDAFGTDLAQANQHLKDYVNLVTKQDENIPPTSDSSIPGESPGRTVRQKEEAETVMNKAWDIYYTVFRQINKQLPALTRLELSDCSPALSRARGLELGIPGSYRVDGTFVRISRFVPNVQVITSKQRPRKITLRGSDGKDYVFLLKGHEDLRQDERVMQLFGLVNALLEGDRQTKKQDLRIQRYAVAPLSHNCGLVGWVPHTDTLHSLIRDYRHTKKIPLNLEHREMLRIAPDYDHLTVMQKVEVFVEALQKTTGNGNDLYEILWLKSTNSEQWLERRTRYTRSLAVMSMVGYILGLGDRHPSNLMLDNLSGRVLHIDFGDCFEVAMHREKYPEKVPFRLTRMLIKAMEVSGIEGSYRSTCERTMSVLRESRDSLVAMLEAFLYDPLISWRLVDLSKSNGDVEASNVISDGRQPSHPGNDVLDEDPGVAIEAHNSRTGVLPISEEGENADEDDENEGIMVSDGIETIPSVPTRRPRDVAVSATRARSLQMYANIQTWAANLGTDGRIASITGGDGTAVAGSIARSRVSERSLRQREVLSLLEGDHGEETLNEKALKVIRRVQDKLNGTDFEDRAETGEPLDVINQVQRLTVQATSVENLSQLFIGWCAFW